MSLSRVRLPFHGALLFIDRCILVKCDGTVRTIKAASQTTYSAASIQSNIGGFGRGRAAQRNIRIILFYTALNAAEHGMWHTAPPPVRHATSRSPSRLRPVRFFDSTFSVSAPQMKANHPINIQTLAPSFLLPHQESLTNTASDQAVIKTPVCFKFTLSQNVFVSRRVF